MWELYHRLIEPIPDSIMVDEILVGIHVTMVKVGGFFGFTATNSLQTVASALTEEKMAGGITWKETASLITSWNFTDASIGAAAVNAFYNQKKHLEENVNQYPGAVWLPEGDTFLVPGEQIETKKVATIGHFCYAGEALKRAKEFYILERDPRDGDYPDSACEYLLPDMDYVYITGFTFVNKTLPRLLELSKHAKVILVGPSVPMAPLLFEYGVTELAGTLIPNPEKVEELVRRGGHKVLARAGKPVRVGIEG